MDLNEAAAPGEGDWYDNIRFELLLSLLADRDVASVVDLGCGQGGILRRLRERDPSLELVGIDPFLTPEHVDALAAADITATPDGDADVRPADAVLLMDVLEHVETPGDLLRRATGLLRPGGLLVITVPAYRWLWSGHDVALGHVDRYTEKRLLELIQLYPQLRILRSGYAFPSLLLGAAPPRLVGRARRRMRGTQTSSSQLDVVGASLASFLELVGRADVRAVGARSPFGLTAVAVATL